jgi:hypothetical protein
MVSEWVGVRQSVLVAVFLANLVSIILIILGQFWLPMDSTENIR